MSIRKSEVSDCEYRAGRGFFHFSEDFSKGMGLSFSMTSVSQDTALFSLDKESFSTCQKIFPVSTGKKKINSNLRIKLFNRKNNIILYFYFYEKKSLKYKIQKVEG